jgi:type IV pilus assembly protein PilE
MRERRKAMDRPHGFSLFELIAVMAIAAILAALAVQSYTRYTLRSHRTDARQMLMAIAASEERWYATYNRYTDDLVELGYANPAISPHGYYELTLVLTGDDEQGFIATAMPTPRQASDVCGSLSVDQAGHKSPDKADAAANTNGGCW